MTLPFRPDEAVVGRTPSSWVPWGRPRDDPLVALFQPLNP